MTVTLKGFQGTISDADMAGMFPHHAPSVASTADLAVTAVAGARTVSAAPGTAFGPFLRYTDDTARQMPLAPPTSGGKWYAITIDRQWSPTNTATMRADDLAVGNDGTVPGTPSVAVLQAAAALPNQPGTAGSTAGQRQLLAFVHVRAADTTLTIFDARLIATRSGVLAVTSLHAMRWAALVVAEGANVALLPHTAPSGAQHLSSTWQRNSAQMKIVGLATVDSTGAAAPFTTDLLNMATAGGNYVALYADQVCVHDLKDKLDYLWTGTDDYAFRPAPSRRTKAFLTLVGARNVPTVTWTDVEWDTVIKDPSGMTQNVPNVGHDIRLPWKGLYRLFVSASLNGGDDAGQIIRIQWITRGGYVIGQDAQYGLVSDYPQQLIAYYDMNLEPGDPNYGYVRPRIFHNPNGGTRQFSYGDDSSRVKIGVEYLGF